MSPINISNIDKALLFPKLTNLNSKIPINKNAKNDGLMNEID